MNRLYQIAVVFALWMAIPTYAVQHYSCDFEDEAARNRWVLNPTANSNIDKNLINRWYIGAPGTNGKGTQYGLYISDDQGTSAHYANVGCWVFAYDTIALDHLSTDGDYTLSFDYCGMGNVASNFDGLYVLWIPMTDPESKTHDSIPVMSVATSSGTVPPKYENYVITLQPQAGMDYLNGTFTWKQCLVTIPNSECDGTPHYLAFVWANGSQQTQQPGGMIDNIEISDTRPCDAPTGLTLTIQGTTCQLSWNGTASAYEVSAYSYETQTWYGPKIVQGNQTGFSGLPIGQTDFIVRAQCAEDLYSLKTSITKLVYYPDQMCVDYLNLDNATCYISDESRKPSDTRRYKDFIKTSPVDFGPGYMESRHTIHFNRDEREPRTGSIAKTIPDGELASVRLGNWDHNNQAERIEFSFEVDTMAYPVLLLKYMPILEAPTHKDIENPRFKLDILVGGQSIGECGQADFNANDVRDKAASTSTTTVLTQEAIKQGWHVTPKDVAQLSADVIWKDWTTVGVNLKNPEYAGKKLTARLTTHDCTFSVHSGYAYFTLGCSDGKLKGMKCGAINPVFEAPDGFVYRWMYASSEKYRQPDGMMPEQYVLGHEQTYEAGLQDDSLYVVDCMFVQDSSCFFSLYASTLATNPVPRMKRPKIQKNCRDGRYAVTFDASASWVQEIDHVTQDTLRSRIYKIENYEWNVEGISGGWSDEVAPTFYFPRQGGTYEVSLRTSSGLCDSTIYYTLHLDSIAETRDTITMTLCDEMRRDGYKWKERPDTTYYDYGIDSVVLVSPSTTCDSIIYLVLKQPHRIYVDTVVLPEQLPFEFHGRSYSKTMVDTIPISPTNCDTTWILNFEVYESLLANMPLTDYILCEDDDVLTLIYDITRGRSLRYSYSFTDTSLPSVNKNPEIQRIGHYEIAIPLSPMPYPNYYEGLLVLEDSFPKWNVNIPFTLTIQYASSIIAQRWNDVLAIKNAEHNGGYEFDSVQWYINGKPIEGAREFNYYTGANEKLKFGESYSALLWRKDGVALFTCAMQPINQADKSDLPTLVPLSSPIHIQGKGTAYWYDTMGRIHHSEPYDESAIYAPNSPGYFLLVLQSTDARTIHSIIVR